MSHPSDVAAPHAPSTPAPPSGSDTGVEPALVDGVDVDTVARAVRACAGVADLYAGRFGEIGSYLPGRRVGGVQVDDRSVVVHIKARWGYGVQDLLAQVGAVTVALRNGRRLELFIDDIDNDLTGSRQSTVNAVTAVAPPLEIASTADPAPPSTDPPPAESSSS